MDLATAGNLCTTSEISAVSSKSDRSRQTVLGALSVPLLVVVLLLVAFLAAPASLVFDCLLFQVIDGLVDGGLHVPGLSDPHQRSVARADGDFRLVAVLFDGQDYFAVKFVAENLADFCQAGFD